MSLGADYLRGQRLRRSGLPWGRQPRLRLTPSVRPGTMRALRSTPVRGNQYSRTRGLPAVSIDAPASLASNSSPREDTHVEKVLELLEHLHLLVQALASSATSAYRTPPVRRYPEPRRRSVGLSTVRGSCQRACLHHRQVRCRAHPPQSSAVPPYLQPAGDVLVRAHAHATLGELAHQLSRLVGETRCSQWPARAGAGQSAPPR